MDGLDLMWGLLFGSIGVGFAIYGRKERRGMPLIVGMALMICPYLISGFVLVLVCIVLMALPYFFRF